MNKKNPECECGSDCKCNPCECTPTSSCCRNGKQHTGTRFWFWASIRILIVVFLIIGSFLLGVRMGFGEFTTRLGMDSYGRGGYYGSMMHQKNRPNKHNPYKCQRYMTPLDQTGETLSASNQADQ